MCMKSPPLAAHVCTYRFWGLLQSALEAGCNPYLRQLSLAVCLAWTCVTTVLAPPCPYVYPWEGIPMDDRTTHPKGLIVYPLGTMAPDPQDL